MNPFTILACVAIFATGLLAFCGSPIWPAVAFVGLGLSLIGLAVARDDAEEGDQ